MMDVSNLSPTPSPELPPQPVMATPPSPPPGETKGRRRRRYVAMGVTSVAVIGLLLLWFYINNAPAVGVIHQGKPTPTQSLSDKATTLVPYTKNPYVTYSYISSYRLVNTQLQTEGELSRAMFTAELPADIDLNVYTQTFQGFDQDGAVHYREAFPQYYKKEVLDSNGLQGLIFTRTDTGFERVAFIAKGNLETVLAMTVNQQDPQNMVDFQRMLNTVAWR